MPSHNLPLVLRKVAHDVRIHVEGHHGHVVLRAQLLGKSPGRIEHVNPENHAPGGILAQQQGRDRRFRALEAFDLLLYPVFVNAEVVRLQAGYELVRLFQQHAHVYRNLGHLNAQAHVAQTLRVFEFGRRWSGRNDVRVFRLLGHGNHAGVAVGTSGIRRRFGRAAVPAARPAAEWSSSGHRRASAALRPASEQPGTAGQAKDGEEWKHSGAALT